MSRDSASIESRAPLPDWYPPWARDLAERYYSGATSTFVLWGNVHDLVRTVENGVDSYVSLEDFLAAQVFGRVPEALLLVDDHLPNIDAARAAGWQAVHFVDAAQAEAEVDALGW